MLTLTDGLNITVVGTILFDISIYFLLEISCFVVVLIVTELMLFATESLEIVLRESNVSLALSTLWFGLEIFVETDSDGDFVIFERLWISVLVD